MRRNGHPSRPRAITCCRFASLKTLLISTKATALRRNQRPRASFSLAGFQVTLIGRFWVTAEAVINGLLAPFLLVAILVVACDKKLMQGQPSSRLGWIVVAITTVAMFAAGVAMFVV